MLLSPGRPDPWQRGLHVAIHVAPTEAACECRCGRARHLLKCQSDCAFSGAKRTKCLSREILCDVCVVQREADDQGSYFPHTSRPPCSRAQPTEQRGLPEPAGPQQDASTADAAGAAREVQKHRGRGGLAAAGHPHLPRSCPSGGDRLVLNHQWAVPGEHAHGSGLHKRFM